MAQMEPRSVQERLLALANSRTSYEIVLAGPRDDQRMLLNYTQKRTRQSLVRNIRMMAGSVLKVTGLAADAEFKVLGCTPNWLCELPEGWTVRFSGRTKRECIVSGELQTVDAAAAKVVAK